LSGQYNLWDVGSRKGRRDNHTDAKFLDRLVINATIARRKLRQVVWESQLVTQQISIAFLVPSTFLHLKNGRLGVLDLLSLNFGMLLLVGVLLVFASLSAGEERTLPIVWRSMRQCALLLTGIFFMSPLYQKLTLSVSSDTIGASSVLLLVLHLYLHDYKFKKSITETVSGAVSLGSAIATSVLLSSRLDTANQVFSYLSFALGLFVLSPFFRKRLHGLSPRAHLVNTLMMVAITVRVVGRISMAFAGAFVILVVLTTFVCPYLLISVEKHKVQISGPWDEAEVGAYKKAE